jgi:hypothetical protein
MLTKGDDTTIDDKLEKDTEQVVHEDNNWGLLSCYCHFAHFWL